MQTEDLIRSLSQDLSPVPRRSVERRLARGVAFGMVGTIALVVFWLGLRPDLGAALGGFPFWMKLVYTLSLGLGGIALTAHLARPDAGRSPLVWLLAVPVILLSGIAAVQLLDTPAHQWRADWLGHSWRACSMLVVALSLPIFLGLLWAFRLLAPTRLVATGAAAGLASGGFAAAIYCLHCPEVSPSFVLTWYTLGIGLAALGGALAGPRLLRW